MYTNFIVLLILLTSSRGEEENTKPYELMTIKNIKHAVTTQLNRCSTILKNVTCQYGNVISGRGCNQVKLCSIFNVPLDADTNLDMMRQFLAIVKMLMPGLVSVTSDEKFSLKRPSLITKLESIFPCFSQLHLILSGAIKTLKKKAGLSKPAFQIKSGSFHTFPMKKDCSGSKPTSKDVQKFGLTYEAYVTMRRMTAKIQLRGTKKLITPYTK